MVSRLASGRNPTRKPDFRPGGITCIVKFVGCRSCGSDSLGAEVAALYFDMSGTPPHARQRSRSRTPPPVGWALGLPEEIVDQPPRGLACLLEASLLEASFFVFEASLLGDCLLEASLFVFEASRLEACLRTLVLRTPVLRTPVLRTPVLRTLVLRTPVLRTPVLRTPVLQRERERETERERERLSRISHNVVRFVDSS